jgi:hypothetical protein
LNDSDDGQKLWERNQPEQADTPYSELDPKLSSAPQPECNAEQGVYLLERS